MKSNPAPPDQPKLHPADWVVQAGALDDVLDGLKVKLKKRRRRRLVVRTASATVFLVAFALFWAVPYVRDTDAIATRPAQRQTLTLADGSRADLNAQTAISTDFRHGRRQVRLDRGEAYFVVTKDSDHPFIVETPAGRVRVTGTEFNVRLAPPGVVITLLEGTVQVTGRADSLQPLALKPGQQATLTGDRADVGDLDPSALGRITAWRDGRAIFDGETLGQAAARFADFHGIRIEVDSVAATQRLGGSYPLHELRDFLKAIEATLPVRVLARDGYVRILPAD